MLAAAHVQTLYMVCSACSASSSSWASLWPRLCTCTLSSCQDWRAMQMYDQHVFVCSDGELPLSKPSRGNCRLCYELVQRPKQAFSKRSCIVIMFKL